MTFPKPSWASPEVTDLDGLLFERDRVKRLVEKTGPSSACVEAPQSSAPGPQIVVCSHTPVAGG